MNVVKRRKADESGFSLLEVLIATAVLAFGILGVAQLFLLSVSTNRRAAQNTESSNLLAHRLEQLRQADYCWLKGQANTAWVPDNLSYYGENIGQTSAKVLQGRAKKEVGTSTANTDWVVQRRILGKSQGLSKIDGMPVEGVILVELRGYRRGVRNEKSPAKPKWIHMSAYRTVRATDDTAAGCP